MRGVDKITCA